MLRQLIALGIFGSLLAGCTYEDRDEHHKGPPGGQIPEQVPSSTIDTGATIAEVEPGMGAGAFIEYAGAGDWHVYTSCDTALAGASSCEWDIIVSVDASSTLDDLVGDRLETYDYLDWETARSARMVTDTSYDFDGFFVRATPGAALRVDVYLDGVPAPRYIYWVGDGGLHSGAPENPIDLIPSEP